MAKELNEKLLLNTVEELTTKKKGLQAEQKKELEAIKNKYKDQLKELDMCISFRKKFEKAKVAYYQDEQPKEKKTREKSVKNSDNQQKNSNTQQENSVQSDE